MCVWKSAWRRGKKCFYFHMNLRCPAGKEKEVWERWWKILLPGGQTCKSLCQEEGGPTSGGEDGRTTDQNEAVRHVILTLIVLLRLMNCWTRSESTFTSRRWNTSTRSIRFKTGRSSMWWNLWVIVCCRKYDPGLMETLSLPVIWWPSLKPAPWSDRCWHSFTAS